MDEIELKILEVLKRHPEGIKARAIAGEIPGTDKSQLNHYLYGSLKRLCKMDSDYKWSLKNAEPSEPDVIVPFTAVQAPSFKITQSTEIPVVKKGAPKNNSVPEDATDVVCPKCGAPMEKRVAKYGFNRGGEFWGCTNFPRCKGTRSIQKSLEKDPVPTVVPKLKEPEPVTKDFPKAEKTGFIANVDKKTKISEPVTKPMPSVYRSCGDCVIYIHGECDGKGNAEKCPAFKRGL